jgi:hypothetical protein
VSYSFAPPINILSFIEVYPVFPGWQTKFLCLQ